MINIRLDELNLVELGKLFKFMYSEIPHLSYDFESIHKIIIAMMDNAGDNATQKELMTLGLSESMVDYWIQSAKVWKYEEDNRTE